MTAAKKTTAPKTASQDTYECRVYGCGGTVKAAGDACAAHWKTPTTEGNTR